MISHGSVVHSSDDLPFAFLTTVLSTSSTTILGKDSRSPINECFTYFWISLSTFSFSLFSVREIVGLFRNVLLMYVSARLDIKSLQGVAEFLAADNNSVKIAF
jgi:hypothetical protein